MMTNQERRERLSELTVGVTDYLTAQQATFSEIAMICLGLLGMTLVAYGQKSAALNKQTDTREFFRWVLSRLGFAVRMSADACMLNKTLAPGPHGDGCLCDLLTDDSMQHDDENWQRLFTGKERIH